MALLIYQVRANAGLTKKVVLAEQDFPRGVQFAELPGECSCISYDHAQ